MIALAAFEITVVGVRFAGARVRGFVFCGAAEKAKSPHTITSGLLYRDGTIRALP